MAGMILQNGLVDLGDGNFERTDLAIDGGRIAAIGGDAGDEGEVVDCGRFAIVPGMVNAHCHSNENWFRGRWDNLPLEPWMLFSYPALAGPVQSSRETYLRTLIGGLDMVHSGATCVVDFLYEMAGFTDESLAAVVSAYRDLGLRALIVLGMGDRAYHETVVLDEGLVDRALIDRLEREKPPTWGEWEEFTRRAVEQLSPPRRGHHDRARAVGPAALHRRVPAELRLARRRARPPDPHPRARDPDAGAVGPEDVRQDAARAHARARLPGAAGQLRARDLADPARHRAGARHRAPRSSTTRSRT